MCLEMYVGQQRSQCNEAQQNAVYSCNFVQYFKNSTEVGSKWIGHYLKEFFILNPMDQVSLQSEFVWIMNLIVLSDYAESYENGDSKFILILYLES